ncbi:MAG: bacteriohemerythrin [Magnetococcales bacterium]|nr:bacteriohemerythrin [Magnetococcales bacterium]
MAIPPGGAHSQGLSVEQFRQSLKVRLREVKVASFHQQHVVLIDYITELYGCVNMLQRHAPTEDDRKTIKKVLDQLKGYALNHFQEEEQYMRQVSFVGLDHHIQAHQKFVNAVLAIEQRIWSESVTHIVDLLHLTVGWLFDHINSVDMLYSRASQGEVIDPELFRPSVQPRSKVLVSRPSPLPPPSTARIVSSQQGSSMVQALKGRLQDVGVPRFNQEHQQLLNQMVQLQGLIDGLRGRFYQDINWQPVDALFDFLKRYVQIHFRAEEEMMQRHGYPHYEQHREEHQKLTERLLELYGKFQRQRDIGLAMDLLFFLIDWLMNHTTTVDVQYRGFFQNIAR